MFFRWVDECVPFEVRTLPVPADIGRALESNQRIDGAMLQLHFGEEVARVPIPTWERLLRTAPPGGARP